MKRVVVLVIAGLFAAGAGAASAQSVTANSIGVYFDAGTYNVHSIEEVPPGSYVGINVALKNGDMPALIGYEFSLLLSNPVMMELDFVPQGTGAVDVGDESGEHIVSLEAPLIVDGTTTLIATWNVLVGPGETYVTLGGATPNAVPGYRGPTLLLADEVIIAAYPVSGFDSSGAPNPCATINVFHPDLADKPSWDQIKATFR